MSVKTSISLSEQQDAFARRMVAEGRYSSVSAVIQSGLERLRDERERQEAETRGLRQLMAERAGGDFIEELDVDGVVNALRAEQAE